MENENTAEQVANETESTEPSTETQEQKPEATESKEASGSEQKYVPYDRFQEIIHARQEAEKRWQESESRVAQMQRDFQSQLDSLRSPQKQAHPLVSKMREIDPAYGEYLEKLEAKANKLDSFEQNFNQYRQEQLRQSYESSVASLHDQNKTPEALRGFIRAQLDAKALSGQINSLGQVQNEYKNILDQYNKILETNAREATKKYVQDKKKDSSVPSSQPKGTAASGKTAPSFNGDREAFLSDIAKRALSRSKAEREVD